MSNSAFGCIESAARFFFSAAPWFRSDVGDRTDSDIPYWWSVLWRRICGSGCGKNRIRFHFTIVIMGNRHKAFLHVSILRPKRRIRKELWSWGLCVESPQRGFALLEVHWHIEITNIKLQISNNFQWPKFENTNDVSSWKVLVIEYWNLRFICNLVLVICDFRHKTAKADLSISNLAQRTRF